MLSEFWREVQLLVILCDEYSGTTFYEPPGQSVSEPNFTGVCAYDRHYR